MSKSSETKASVNAQRGRETAKSGKQPAGKPASQSSPHESKIGRK